MEKFELDFALNVNAPAVLDDDPAAEIAACANVAEKNILSGETAPKRIAD